MRLEGKDYIVRDGDVHALPLQRLDHIGSDHAAAPYVKAVPATGKPVFRAQLGRFGGRPGGLIAVPLFETRAR
jgi:hypothetical protein